MAYLALYSSMAALRRGGCFLVDLQLEAGHGILEACLLQRPTPAAELTSLVT